MTETETAFYRSSWYLIRESDSDQMSVRHQPNGASGGQSLMMELSEFLSEGHGPQHDALLHLLNTMPGR
jgi:hypothetical protein